MRYIYGKEILETLEEIVDPRHAALVILDVQNDTCSSGGAAGRAGRDLSMMPEMVLHLQGLLEEARRQKLLRVFVQTTVLPGGRSDSGAWLYRNLAKGIRPNPEDDDFCIEGTWGHQVVAELQPLPEELRVKKRRSSAFYQTNLHLLLTNNGIKTLIVTGVETEDSVDATVRDAFYHDYYAVVPPDCVASSVREFHDTALFISKADKCTSADLSRLWAKLPEPARRI